MAGIFRHPCAEAQIRSARTAAPCSPESGPWILAATILGSSMAFIDGTVVNIALPALQSRMNAKLEEAGAKPISFNDVLNRADNLRIKGIISGKDMGQLQKSLVESYRSGNKDIYDSLVKQVSTLENESGGTKYQPATPGRLNPYRYTQAALDRIRSDIPNDNGSHLADKLQNTTVEDQHLRRVYRCEPAGHRTALKTASPENSTGDSRPANRLR